MGLKPLHLAALYLFGIALISIGVGFFDWRFGVVSFGAGIVLPVITLPEVDR